MLVGVIVAAEAKNISILFLLKIKLNETKCVGNISNPVKIVLVKCAHLSMQKQVFHWKSRAAKPIHNNILVFLYAHNTNPFSAICISLWDDKHPFNKSKTYYQLMLSAILVSISTSLLTMRSHIQWYTYHVTTYNITCSLPLTIFFATPFITSNWFIMIPLSHYILTMLYLLSW